MEIQQAIALIEAFGQQALQRGLFTRFQDVGIWEQAIRIIKAKVSKVEAKQNAQDKEQEHDGGASE